jgi:hypothetical protein
VLAAFIIQLCWKRHRHGLLLIYCLAVIVVHAAAFLLTYRFAGRTNAWLAGSMIAIELGVFSALAERVIPTRRD